MPPGPRRRLDVDLVRRGLAATREQAQRAIADGRVLVGGAVADRPSRLVAPGEPVELLGAAPRYVGRGGEKLDAALAHFGVDVAGAVALDAGASTGGFTDCLLQHGARLVVAVDVGHGQLDASLRGDARVVVLERTHVADLTPARLAAAGLAEPVDLVTADLSFISLRRAAPALAGPLLREGGRLLLLVKPQFEVGRVAAARGRGVIRDPDLWLAALRAVASTLEACGAVIMGAVASPLAGASGNREFFLHALSGTAGCAPAGAAPCAGGDPLSDAADRLVVAAVEAVGAGR